VSPDKINGNKLVCLLEILSWDIDLAIIRVKGKPCLPPIPFRVKYDPDESYRVINDK
jgi:hypothetical protein